MWILIFYVRMALATEQNFKMTTKKKNMYVKNRGFINCKLLFLFVFFSNCKNPSTTSKALPILGPKHATQIEINGALKDTIVSHQVPEFQFTNQYERSFGSEDLKGKVYLTEFFFTSCPSVCPKVAEQMQAIHKDLSKEEGFALVSITLDGKRDTPQKLFNYAEKKGANDSNWYFLNAPSDDVIDLAWDGYFVAASMDGELADDIMHKGTIVLVDQSGYVRGMYDGKAQETVGFVKRDVGRLLQQKI